MDARKIIINADDFGRSAAVNAAVLRAHREGVLTSASLMVTGEAWEEAVALARSTPTLAVGLHRVVGNGWAVLPHREIPHLVDSNGRFPDDPLRIGLDYWFNRATRVELAREVEAQLGRFVATGLPLSHVDGHMHLHVHPVVFELLLPLAEAYGARGVRLPRDDLRLALGYDHRQIMAKAALSIALGVICGWCQTRLGATCLTTAHRVYGVLQSGQMCEPYVMQVLRRLQEPSAELYFHPTTSAQGEALGPSRGDLDTLLSPAVQQVIVDRSLRLSTYATLEEAR